MHEKCFAGIYIQVTPLQRDTYVTQIHWLPAVVGGARKQTSHSELFVLTCTDGNTPIQIVLLKHRSRNRGGKGAVPSNI